MYLGEIENELTKFVMKFKHLMKLARPTLPDPSTTMPKSRRDLQTDKERKTTSDQKVGQNLTKLQQSDLVKEFSVNCNVETARVQANIIIIN